MWLCPASICWKAQARAETLVTGPEEQRWATCPRDCRHGIKVKIQSGTIANTQNALLREWLLEGQQTQHMLEYGIIMQSQDKGRAAGDALVLQSKANISIKSRVFTQVVKPRLFDEIPTL